MGRCARDCVDVVVRTPEPLAPEPQPPRPQIRDFAPAPMQLYPHDRDEPRRSGLIGAVGSIARLGGRVADGPSNLWSQAQVRRILSDAHEAPDEFHFEDFFHMLPLKRRLGRQKGKVIAPRKDSRWWRGQPPVAAQQRRWTPYTPRCIESASAVGCSRWNGLLTVLSHNVRLRTDRHQLNQGRGRSRPSHSATNNERRPV